MKPAALKRQGPNLQRWLAVRAISAFGALGTLSLGALAQPAPLAQPALAAPAKAPGGPAALGPIANPLWLRYPALSPDGQQVAFAFQGNLFVVPAAGGVARLLVSNGSHSLQPVWSPDSRHIAYASDPFGNFDVFIVAAAGGPSRRLTTHSAGEMPIGFTPDGRAVLFSAQRLDAPAHVQFPSRGATELYQVSVEGGKRPTQLLTTPALSGQLNKAGTQLIYEDWKGVESPWRKHHVSPVARDIWLHDVRTGSHRQLTNFGGEDRNPVWSPDEQAVFYLSEKSGSFNVWKMPLNQPEAAVQVTNFSRNPVRFLSVAANGTLSFGYDGELYTLAPGAAQPTKLAVQISADTRLPRIENLKLSTSATEMALSPDGQEVAFVVRGEVFVTSVEFGDTRRITDTAAQERSVSFSPDGRRLLFAGEREGSWNLYEATLVGSKKDAPHFYNATQVQTRTLLKNGRENFQPRYSPDGKEVAFLENRSTLKVLNLATQATRVVMPGEMSYSYSDGDEWFEWSPDGQSLLVSFVDRNRWSSEVGLFDAAGKAPMLNLTQSGFEDTRPVFTRGGQAMMWRSDRMGLRGTSGNAHMDLFALFLTRTAYDRFNLDKAEFAQLKAREEEDAKEAKEGKDKAGKPDGKDSKDTKPADKAAASASTGAKAPAGAAGAASAAAITLPPPVKIDREGLEDRVVRLTPNSGDLRAGVMTPDGETVLFVMQTADSYELWSHRPRSGDLTRLASLPAAKNERGDPEPLDLQLDAKGDTAFLLADGGIQKFKVPKEDGGEAKLSRLKFTAELRLNRAAERAEMFEHVWRQTREKLYVADMNGKDWAYYRQVYERQLPFVADNHAFSELLSEMLGELDVSHTGSGYRPRNPEADSTASLGVFFDDTHRGAGLKIAEVIDGSPLQSARSLAKAEVKAGMFIEKIDGVQIEADAEFDSLLNQKAGKRVELSLRDPATGQRFDVTVRPIPGGALNELLYKRWVKTQRSMVDRLSNGRLGYVHVRGMDEASFRTVFSEALGRHSGKEALIVDTRFNGGGNLHDELTTFLSGRKYLEFVPRGQSLGWEPTGRWTKPSVVLMSESNYSDAHLFPWVYRHLGIGKLIGMPVAGTGTAVWWETLQDPTLFFGIPEVGFRDARGEYMEKARVDPDIRMPQDPALLPRGRDLQTEAAVAELLKR